MPADMGTVKIANSIWPALKTEIAREYLSQVKKYYDADLTSLDYDGQRDASVNKINAWMEEHTNNEIKEFMRPDDLDVSANVVIACSMHLQFPWALYQPFGTEDTRRESFYTGRSIISADMMIRTSKAGEDRLGYAETDDFQLCTVPMPLYQESRQSYLAVLLPKKAGGLSRIEQKFNEEFYDGLLASLYDRSGPGKPSYPWEYSPNYLALPKISVSARLDMMDILPGLSGRFRRDKIDFLGMDFPSTIIHQASFQIDEAGKDAAIPARSREAAYGHGYGGPSQVGFDFVADHPFVFWVREGRTGVILYMGRYAGEELSSAK
jgi:serpin B